MTLLSLSTEHFRNLASVKLRPSPSINLLYGQNGSGKTSLLEAIYLLTFGRSFRIRNSKQIIQHQQDMLRVVANCEVTHKGVTQETIVGMERAKNGRQQVKVGGHSVNSVAEVAELLPVQLMSIKNYQLLSQSPQDRRRLLDWGVFHVEHQFLFRWKQLMQALKQRNALLKQGGHNVSEMACWTNSFVEASDYIHTYRQQFCQHWFRLFKELLSGYLPDFKWEIIYKPGWKEDVGLTTVLDASFDRDKQLGFTQFGAHRADVAISANGTNAGQVLSTGQQKCLVTLLLLAQAVYVSEITGKKPIYLIDDLPAELDKRTKQQLFETLQSLDAQVFITAVENDAFGDFFEKKDAKMFYVEQGLVKEVV